MIILYNINNIPPVHGKDNNCKSVRCPGLFRQCTGQNRTPAPASDFFFMGSRATLGTHSWGLGCWERLIIPSQPGLMDGNLLARSPAGFLHGYKEGQWQISERIRTSFNASFLEAVQDPWFLEHLASSMKLPCPVTHRTSSTPKPRPPNVYFQTPRLSEDWGAMLKML